MTLTSDVSADVPNHVVLVTLPDGFDNGHAQPQGKDIRFRVTPDATSDLDHWTEQWSPGAAKLVWVKVPLVKPGVSDIAMF